MASGLDPANREELAFSQPLFVRGSAVMRGPCWGTGCDPVPAPGSLDAGSPGPTEENQDPGLRASAESSNPRSPRTCSKASLRIR